MFQIGEIKKAREIEHKSNGGGNNFIWHACIDCGKTRWVELRNGQPRNSRCKFCSDKIRSKTFTARYKGIPHLGNGRSLDGDGYVLILLRPDDFFYSMADRRGHIREHRFVMAKHLGRNLHRWELVHHKNNIRDDNRIENLQLVSDDRHQQITLLENKIKFLEQKIKLLESK